MKLYTHTLQIKIHAPKRLTASQVASMVDTLIAVGWDDASETSEMDEEEQIIDPTDTLRSALGIVRSSAPRSGRTARSCRTMASN